MQKSARGNFCAETAGGETHPTVFSKVYSTPVNPVRLNSTTFLAASQQGIINSSSGSFVKFTSSPLTKSDGAVRRSSIKQMRYDARRPTELETSWHSRSFSEHSYLNPSFRPQVSFNDSPTIIPTSLSTLSIQQSDYQWTPSGYVQEVQSEPLKRRASQSNALPHVSSVSKTAGNMILAMAQLQSKALRSPTKSMSFLRRGSNDDSSGITFQMFVNGVKQSGLMSNSDAIKRRLLEDYELNRRKEVDFNEASLASTGPPHPTLPYFKELTSLQSQRGIAASTLDRHRSLRKHSQIGTVYIPSQPVDSSMTRSEYNDRIMDYRGNSTVASRVVTGGRGGGGFSDYSSGGSISAVTSPTISRGLIKPTEHTSPNSVIEELQSRFQNSTRSREKRPILKNAPANADYVTPVYQRRIATAGTATTTLASRPHHQSELVLPTTTAASFEQPLRSINTASTVRLDPDPNGTLRATEGSGYRGGPSFRRLQTLYGTNINQKRFPSDNALDMTYLEGKPQQPSPMRPQFFVSGRKAGTVKIQVRSRSEHASPTNGPPSSPRQAFRVASAGGGGGLGGGSGVTFDDRIRSKQVILPQAVPISSQASSRGPNTSFSVDEPQTEDDENLVLPSVREIIRQVEEMTLKNSSAHNSTTSLSRHPYYSYQQPASPGPSQHMSRSIARPMDAEQYGGTANRSQSASSILTNGGGHSKLINHDGGYHGSGSNPDDFYANSFSQGYATTRQGDLDSDGRRNATNSAFYIPRKGEQITNLPQDYQKLLEAFLEQRRQIQRLRKEIMDKDRLIASLEKDIHMYEPWR
ncbi:conserved hypothetical protein [Echinococcus multilocularis]|uniref:Uncharacterized protein n=1 Tax=Echinococcus multilocularis TaxID=6211 RepID=A0A068Y542_ECHMU|nr:conserved hypothetical protein [Echinococcus multilocularis]